MVSIDQVVGEIIVNNVCVLCELEKIGLIDYKHIKSFNNSMIIFLIGAVLTNPKQNNNTYIFDTFHNYYSHVKYIFNLFCVIFMYCVFLRF